MSCEDCLRVSQEKMYVFVHIVIVLPFIVR